MKFLTHFLSLLIFIFEFVISQTADLYISYNETNFICDESEILICGNLTKPFSSILQAFYYIDVNSQNLIANYSELNMYLISDYYIIDDGNATYYLSRLNDVNLESLVYWPVFKRLSDIKINIIPLNKRIPIVIAIKSLLLSFYLNKISFSIENVIFNGGDLDIEYLSGIIPDCFYWKIGCCFEESNEITDPFLICRSSMITFFSPDVQTNFFVLVGFNNVFRIFSCSFLNLLLNKVYSSFYMNAFLLDQAFDSKIIIEKSIFENIEAKSFIFGNLKRKDSTFFRYSGKFLWNRNIMAKIRNPNHIFDFSYLNLITMQNSEFEDVDLLVLLSYNLMFIFENNLLHGNNGLYFYGDLIKSLSNKIFLLNNTIEGVYNNLRIFSLSGLITIKKIVINIDKMINSGFSFNSEWSDIWFEDLYLSISELQISDQIIFQLNAIMSLKMLNSKINNLNDKICVLFNGTVQTLSIRFNILSAIKGGLSLNILRNNVFHMHYVYFNNTSIEFADESNIIVSNCMFYQENSMNTNIFLMKSNAFMYLFNSLFDKITTLNVGSIFNLRNQNCIIIKNSTYFSIQSFEGGSILFADTSNKIKFINCSFNNLISFDKGGGILLIYSNFLILTNIKVFNCSSLNSGGFLHTSQEKNVILVKYSEIRKCLSGTGGVMFINFGSFIFISNAIFIDSTANLDGGTLVFNHKIFGYIKNTMISNSNSKEIAGFISLLEKNKIKIFESAFYNASSNIAGGFNIKYENKIIIESCLFQKIIANDAVGCLKSLSENRIVLRNIYIEEVNSDGKGGVFYFQDNNSLSLNSITIDNSHSLSDFLLADQNNRIIFKNVSKINSDKIIAYSLFLFQKNDNSLYLSNFFLFQNKFSYFAYSTHKNFILLKDFFIRFIEVSNSFLQLDQNSKILINNLHYENKSKSAESFKFLKGKKTTLLFKNLKINMNTQKLIQLGECSLCKIKIENSEFFRMKNILNKVFLNMIYCLVIFKKVFGNSVDFYFEKSKVFFEKSAFSFSINALIQLIDKDENYFVSSSLLIKQCFFYSNKNQQSKKGGIIFIPKESILIEKIIVLSSIFSFNQACLGGSFYISNLNELKMAHNKFKNNEAKANKNELGKGGVIYFDSDNYDLFDIEENLFHLNRADIGGIIYIKSGFNFINRNKFLMKNTIINNTIIYYGQTIATYPIKISLDTFPKESKYIKNLISGKAYEDCLTYVIPYDWYDNWVSYIDEIEFLETKVIEQNSLQQKNWRMINGQICFAGYFQNNQISNSKIFFSNMSYNFYHNNIFIKTSFISVSYNFRSCGKGEKLNENFICSYCPKNFYSFETNVDFQTTCKLCSADMGFYCFGGNNISIKPSFWRKSIESTNILACPNSDACHGDPREFEEVTEYNPKYSLQSCKKGYIDPLCSVCDIGYGRTTRNSCVKCESIFYIFKSFILCFFQFFFFLYTISHSLNNSCSLYEGKIDNKDRISMDFLKIFNIHAQILIILFALEENIFDIKIILEINPFNSNFSDNLSFECILKAIGRNFSYYYSKLMISLLSPIFFLIIMILLFKTMFSFCISFKKIHKFKTIAKKLGFFLMIKSVFYINLSLQGSNVLRDCFDSLIFTNIEDDNITPEYRLIVDYSIRYDSYKHYFIIYLLIIPTILFFCIIFPFFIFFQLLKYKRRKLLKDPTILFTYGFFFYSYKEQSFYWDLTFVFRKIFILIIVSFTHFLDYFSNEKPLFIITILMLCISTIRMLLNKIKPYKKKFQIVMILEDSSLKTISITLIFLSLLLLLSNKKENYFINVLRLFFIVCIFTANLIFFCFFGYYYFKQGFTIQEHLASFFHSMPSKFLKFNFISRIVKKYTISSEDTERKKLINEKEKLFFPNTFSPTTRIYLKKKSKRIIDLKRREFKKFLNHFISKNSEDFFKYRFVFLTFEGSFYTTLFKDQNLKIKMKYGKKKEKKEISVDFSIKIIHKSLDYVEIESQLNFSNHFSYKNIFF